MSGGRFNYADRSLAYDIFDEFPYYGMGNKEYKEKLKRVKRRNRFEDKVISELIFDVFCLINSYDWYASDDTSEETYRKDVNFFKKKWLKLSDEKRVRQYIDDELEFAREELIKALVVGDDNG